MQNTATKLRDVNSTVKSIVSALSNNPHTIVYTDKLKSGVRSVKINKNWGRPANLNLTTNVASVLWALGYNVKIVKTHTKQADTYRIHVTA